MISNTRTTVKTTYKIPPKTVPTFADDDSMSPMAVVGSPVRLLFGDGVGAAVGEAVGICDCCGATCAGGSVPATGPDVGLGVGPLVLVVGRLVLGEFVVGPGVVGLGGVGRLVGRNVGLSVEKAFVGPRVESSVGAPVAPVGEDRQASGSNRAIQSCILDDNASLEHPQNEA